MSLESYFVSNFVHLFVNFMLILMCSYILFEVTTKEKKSGSLIRKSVFRITIT
jgi:hypothetical protein